MKWPANPPNARFLQVCDTSVANCEVHDPPASRTEADENSILWKLHSVDQLALALDDVVDRNAVDVLARSDPEISIRVGACGPGRKRWLVVGQLARRDHRERRQRASEGASA